jgi:hypothetical protein
MTPKDIPDEVLRFIADQIDTVPHMEALLLLWESAPKPWTEEELAARLYVDVDTARRILHDFSRRKFAVSTGSPQSTYAYDPANDSASLLPLVAVTYRRDLVQVARFIHSKGSQAMREFSRAFKFKDER